MINHGGGVKMRSQAGFGYTGVRRNAHFRAKYKRPKNKEEKS